MSIDMDSQENIDLENLATRFVDKYKNEDNYYQVDLKDDWKAVFFAITKVMGFGKDASESLFKLMADRDYEGVGIKYMSEDGLRKYFVALIRDQLQFGFSFGKLEKCHQAYRELYKKAGERVKFLKSCPFCGCDKIQFYSSMDSRTGESIEAVCCSKCGISIRTKFLPAGFTSQRNAQILEVKEELVKRWNTRAED